MMLSCTIDAKENRYIIVSDIPGAFLHADMEDNVHMLLEGTVAEMIVKLDPTTYKNICGTTNMAKQCYMYNSKKPYMGHYKWLFYSGNYYQRHYRSGVLH